MHASSSPTPLTNPRPGDEDEKARLEELVASFDPEPYWSEYHSTLLSTRQYELQTPPKPIKTEPSSQLDEAVTAPGELPRDTRGPNESVANFLSRLPPSKTSELVVGPWIWAYGPSLNAVKAGDVPSFLRKGTELLRDYEETESTLRAAHDKSGAKTTGPLTRKLNIQRRELETNILTAARECDVTAGKWMFFPSASHVDSVWKTIVTAVDKGDLGGCVKVATDSGSGQTRLICVYTHDFGDKEDVKRVLEALVEMELVDGEGRPIYYKCDAYTHLDITSKNQYGLKASMFSSRDVLAGKM